MLLFLCSVVILHMCCCSRVRFFPPFMHEVAFRFLSAPLLCVPKRQVAQAAVEWCPVPKRNDSNRAAAALGGVESAAGVPKCMPAESDAD